MSWKPFRAQNQSRVDETPAENRSNRMHRESCQLAEPMRLLNDTRNWLKLLKTILMRHTDQFDRLIDKEFVWMINLNK